MPKLLQQGHSEVLQVAAQLQVMMAYSKLQDTIRWGHMMLEQSHQYKSDTTWWLADDKH